MARIEVLTSHTANQIAAGEVVERPASVVKELVENAIDAHATSISIAIEDGGIRSILVVDNGVGIPQEDCQTAFLRHATSKIRSIDDLNGLSTMGFRGEALASIAAVSSVVLTTRTADSETGTRVTVECGEISEVESVASVCGTSVCVLDLFGNVPARLKFLKSARTEAGYVGDFVARMILSHPEIAFRYVSNGNVIYETYGDGDLFAAIYVIYGASVADHMIHVSFDNAYLRLDGYIGQHELNRPNRTFQSLFVNGRYIRSFPVSGAVMRAYDTRLMNGRFPMFVLNLTIAPQEMDVNVHPSKMEVRFTDEHRVTGAVYAACRNTLNEPACAETTSDDSRLEEPERPNVALPPQERMMHDPPTTVLELNETRVFSNYTPVSKSGEDTVPTIRLTAERKQPVYSTPDAVRILPDCDAYNVVGCLFRTYWVVTRGDDVYLIDQHAAHERRLYERYIRNEVAVSSQNLLLPISLTLSPSEADALHRYTDELTGLGFSWEPVGELSIELSSLPVLNGNMLRDEYLHEVLSLLAERSRDVTQELCRDRIIRSACKHAIKAGEDMTDDEIWELIAQYAASDSPLTCPHGRPILLRYTKRDLEKRFKRIV